MSTSVQLKDDGWFQRKRERSTLPKLHLMLGRMWALGEMIRLGDRRAWVLGRYETYGRAIELNVPE